MKSAEHSGTSVLAIFLYTSIVVVLVAIVVLLFYLLTHQSPIPDNQPPIPDNQNLGQSKSKDGGSCPTCPKFNEEAYRKTFENEFRRIGSKVVGLMSSGLDIWWLRNPLDRRILQEPDVIFSFAPVHKPGLKTTNADDFFKLRDLGYRKSSGGNVQAEASRETYSCILKTFASDILGPSCGLYVAGNLLKCGDDLPWSANSTLFQLAAHMQVPTNSKTATILVDSKLLTDWWSKQDKTTTPWTCNYGYGGDNKPFVVNSFLVPDEKTFDYMECTRALKAVPGSGATDFNLKLISIHRTLTEALTVCLTSEEELGRFYLFSNWPPDREEVDKYLVCRKYKNSASDNLLLLDTYVYRHYVKQASGGDLQ